MSSQSRSSYYFGRLRQAYARAETDRRLRRRFPSAQLAENIQVVSPHLLELGEDVLVQGNAVLHCGGLEWSGGRGGILLESNVVIGSNCVLWGAGEIRVERGAEFGPGCMVFSSAQDFMGRVPVPKPPPLVFAPVRVGRYASVYSGVILSPGVTIGEGAVVGAGSVVISDVPSREFWAGAPAQLVRKLPDWPAPPTS